MLLITFHEWLGPGRHYPGNQKPPAVTERQVAFYSRLPLAKALKRVVRYQEAFNERYQLAVNFTLLGVATVDLVPDEVLDTLGVQLVERLAQRPEDVGR